MFGHSFSGTPAITFDLENKTATQGGFISDDLSAHTILSMAGMESLCPLVEDFLQDINPDWRIQMADLNDYAYDMDVDEKILTLNTHGLVGQKALQSKFFAPQILLALIEGLRMVRHVELLDGALEHYSPEMIIRIGRVCMADCVTQTIRAAWDSKCMDHDGMWKHLLCGEYGGLAHKFATVMEKFLSSGMDGDMATNQTMAVVFNDWFSLQDRVFQCDHDSLDMMDDMLADGVAFGSKILEPLTIACLTTHAGDTITYLQKPHVDDVAANPYYTNVDHTINRIHLSQILNDMQSTCVNGVHFRDGALAARFLNIGE